jgi:DNA-binding transcriptional LysR family regulator
MAASEWLRTFVAVYRTGSVSEAAVQRGLSQPAASQQLGALERSVASPLFVRTARGMDPTRRGRELYGQVADALDRLEALLSGIDGGRVSAPPPALRFGSSAEYFSAVVLPAMVGAPGTDGPPLAARFGTDEVLIDLLHHGEVDVIVTSAPAGRRTVVSTPIGRKRFLLVAAPALASGAPTDDVAALGRWLVGMPWVAYSAELPLTRRFWLSRLGRPFGGDLRLTAPDLRAVASAVERGLGVSLLPSFACADAMARGQVVELPGSSGLVPDEPWFACTRAADVGKSTITSFVSSLAAATAG